MEFYTLAALLSLITGGIALDGYIHPRTLVVHVVHDGSNAGAGLTTDFVAGVINNEVDRMTSVRSLLARPRIDPSDQKGFVGALGQATGTAAFFSVIESTFQNTPNTLNFALYTEAGKLKVYVYGFSVASIPAGERFELTVTQDDGETPVDTIKRATVAGAAQIDPYLAVLYLLAELDRSGHERYAMDALSISQSAKDEILPSTESLALARLLNLEGLIHLVRGDLDQASAAFSSGLSTVPLGDKDPTLMILRLNQAFVDVARNDTDGATKLLAEVNASTNGFANLAGTTYRSSEGAMYSLTDDEIEGLRSAYGTISAYVALRLGKIDEAELFVRQVLQSNPSRANTVALLADIEGLRGNKVAEKALRNSAVKVSFTTNPFLEIALLHARLSFVGDTVSVKPSQYILR